MERVLNKGNRIMEQLTQKIKKLTPINSSEAIQLITSMIDTQSMFIPLHEDTLLNALSIQGEYLALKLKYEEFDNELKYETLKYKISQSLSVIVSYEEDGKSFSKIEKFVNYIHKFSDSKQNSIFGIKKVDKLSEFPITILFSGILPINQLRMNVGKKIYELIHSDDEYFKPKFQAFRDQLSQEIGIPILPLFPLLDENLKDMEVTLIDLFDGRLISRFETILEVDNNLIDIYLNKLIYIYKRLASKKCYNSL